MSMASTVIASQQPEAALVVEEGTRARCCDHNDQVEPGQDSGGWVRALAVATFDVGTGHTLEQLFPGDSLDDSDRQRIRMLAMPDCNTTQIGDCFYCFRTRKSHRLPLMSSSLVDQHFEYCYAFFRQERNQECARGMFQKSVVLVSRYPYVNLFERLVKVIGPLYFSHGPAVLEAVFASVEEWPAPCPGSLCALPFLSETIMFQVPEIDMPPQVAAKYRWHRGVHLCSLWPRSRVRGLRRSLSGCGSADFQHSPSSRRASNNLTPPTDSGALRSESVGAGKQLDGDSGVATSTRATPDDGHSISGRDESPLRQAGDIDAGTGNEGGGVSSYGVVDGAGIEGRANNTLWSGTARSSGALVPPGLDEFQRLKRSSLGSGSLASVVCDSPSESWLATPKSGNTPLLALDGASGSNLAQSCYYVADRDSDEDDYSEEEEERRRLVNEIGWQGQQDDHSDEDEHDVEHDGRCPGEDGINVADDAGVGVSPSGDWREPRGDEQVPSESRAQEEDGDEEAPGNEREVSALQAAYSAAAEAAAVELRASQNGVDAPLNENGPSQVDAPQEAVAADRVCDVKASPLVENEKPSLSKPNDWRQRPTSLSPPRTSEMAFDRTKTYPNAGSQTPGPMSSSGRLVGLRAWADAAPESPWEAPPPIAADTAAKAKESKSKGRKAAPSPIVRAAYDGVKDPVTELEELLERRGRRSVRGRGDKSKGKGEVSPKGGKMAETAVESGVNAAGADAGALAPAMRDVSSEDTRGVVKVAEEVGVVPVAEEKERGAEEEKGSVGGDDAGEDTAEDVVAVEAGHANGNVHGVLQDQRTVAPEAVASPGESGVAAGGGRSSGVVGVRGEGGEEDASGRRLTRRSSSSSVRLSQDGRERGRDGRPPMPNKTNSHDKNIHRSASNLQGGRSPFAEMLLADEARFRAKQGLFQSIGLYSIFGKKLVEHLWLLWELVITASPTLVVGSSVGASSAAILGMVSLASPVYFCGDFRPHFTTFDPDYRDIVTAHDRVSKQQLWGSSVLGDANTGFPSMLLGVINPIFLRSLSRWPNAIVLPGAAGRSGGSNASAAAHRKMHKHPSASEDDPSPKNRSCPTANQVAEGLAAARPPPVRVQVVRSSTSLEHVIAADERPHEPIIVSRQQPVMVPDVSVLSRLLDPASPYNPTTAAAAAAAASTPVHGQPPTPIAGVVAAASAAAAAEAAGGPETKGQWRDSLRAINDIILRRHFADLTRSFLAPYTKYFRRSRPLQPLSVWQQRAVTRLSVYTEAEVLLPHFDEEEFLTLMFVAGPPKSFAHVQWETLYRRFMDSPNFRPWFNTQRSEAVERIREVSRAVCLRTTTQGMLDACAPGRLPQFLAKIKASIVREWKRKGQSVDWELLERMEMHQKGVEAAIAHQSHSAASATGSIQP